MNLFGPYGFPELLRTSLASDVDLGEVFWLFGDEFEMCLVWSTRE